MKTGYMEYDVTFEGVVSVDVDDVDAIIVNSDYGIYNILYKKQILNADGEVCGTLYIHTPNCTLGNGTYIIHPVSKDRTTISYYQLYDLAKVTYNTSCFDLFKALGNVIYPDGYKPDPNRAERREKNDC